MEVFWAERSGGNGRVESDTAGRAMDVHSLTDSELDRRIRMAWDVWCDLVDDLVSTAGMLPSRDLAGRLLGFFEDGYWRAEEARVEALRRRLAVHDLRRCRVSEWSRGIR